MILLVCVPAMRVPDDSTQIVGAVLDFVESKRGGRGRGRGGSIQLASVFVPPSGRGGSRGGFRGAGPSTPRGRGSFTPRGRGDFQLRGRGEPIFRGRGRGDSTLRGRGRGFGYADGGEYRNRLLEPIQFVPAEITPRVLFEEESKEEIFKAEMIDSEQGMYYQLFKATINLQWAYRQQRPYCRRHRGCIC